MFGGMLFIYGDFSHGWNTMYTTSILVCWGRETLILCSHFSGLFGPWIGSPTTRSVSNNNKLHNFCHSPLSSAVMLLMYYR